MAHDHRMNPIADPYINQRNETINRMAQMAHQNWDANSIRTALGLHSSDTPSLEGRSNMQDDYDDEERGTTTDRDLESFDTGISPAVRAYQESGHGVQIISPMGMQPKKKKG
jgi:hypothetical protein